MKFIATSHPDRYVPTQHSRGEIIAGLAWLSLGALVSVLLEIVYLGAWITLPSGRGVPFPVSILVAFGFNWVLTRTALLWKPGSGAALIPVFTWLAGYIALTFGPALAGHILVGLNTRSLLLMLVGAAGGYLPYIRFHMRAAQSGPKSVG